MEKLRERGLNIWIDQEGIHGAKLWSQEIVNAIESSKVFILFASAKAFLSKNVTKELALASESDKHILPVFLEDAEIPAAMKYQLAGIQHLVHEKGQAAQTSEKILSTLGNLDIQSSEPRRKPLTTPPTSKKHASKIPIFASAFVLLLAFICFFLFYSETDQQASTAIYKSTIDLCVVTISEAEGNGQISKENRALRDELIAKLTRFHEYKIVKGETLSPDATSFEYAELSKKLNSDFILQIIFDPEKEKVLTQLFDGTDGRSLWSKSIGQDDISSDEEIMDESTRIIAGNVAGYDGVIHRKILHKSLVKKEEDLTAIELLQIGKSTWQDRSKVNVIRAIDYLERCVALNPEIVGAYSELSLMYQECFIQKIKEIPDPLSKAKKASNKSIELDPKDAWALSNAFWLLWHERDYKSCEQHIKIALAANPCDPGVLISAGCYKIVRNIDVEEGLRLCMKALDYNESPQGWYYWPLSTYYSRKGEYKKSLEYQIAANWKTNDDIATTAILYWLLGKKETSLKIFSDIKKRNNSYSMKNYTTHYNAWDNTDMDHHLKAFMEIESAYEKQ